MAPVVDVSLEDLEAALDWVSVGGALENAAFISKTTGTVYFWSADGPRDNEIPGDIEDLALYWAVPHKNEFNLGRKLALRFVEEHLPEDFPTVNAFFSHRGAYSQFKNYLLRRDQLNRWYQYERAETREALLEWAAECGFRVIVTPNGPART